MPVPEDDGVKYVHMKDTMLKLSARAKEIDKVSTHANRETRRNLTSRDLICDGRLRRLRSEGYQASNLRRRYPCMCGKPPF